MQLQGLEKVAIEPGQLRLDEYWNPVAHFRRSNYEISWEEQDLGEVSQGIYRLNCVQTLEKHVLTLRRRSQFGYLSLDSHDAYLDSKWLPLGHSFIYIPGGESLSLKVRPQRYFPSIEIQLFRFTGEWSERLRDIEEKIDSLQSPVDVVVDFLDSPDSPLSDIQEQIEGIPDQITETFSVLLDAGEIDDAE